MIFQSSIDGLSMHWGLVIGTVEGDEGGVAQSAAGLTAWWADWCTLW